MALHDLTISALNETEKTHLRFAEYRAFTGQSHCVSTLYLRQLGNVACGTVQKVIVAVADEGSAPIGEEFLEFELLIDVLVVRRTYPIRAHWSLNEQGRRRALLDMLHQALLRTADAHGWPLQPFENAYSESLARDLVTEGVWPPRGRKVWDPTKKLGARIYWRHDCDAIDLRVVIADRTGAEVIRVPLAQLPPHRMFLEQCLGSLRWKSPREVILHSRNKKNSWRCKLAAELKYLPALQPAKKRRKKPS